MSIHFIVILQSREYEYISMLLLCRERSLRVGYLSVFLSTTNNMKGLCHIPMIGQIDIKLINRRGKLFWGCLRLIDWLGIVWRLLLVCWLHVHRSNRPKIFSHNTIPTFSIKCVNIFNGKMCGIVKWVNGWCIIPSLCWNTKLCKIVWWNYIWMRLVIWILWVLCACWWDVVRFGSRCL